jgi:hypothetical protein
MKTAFILALLAALLLAVGLNVIDALEPEVSVPVAMSAVNGSGTANRVYQASGAATIARYVLSFSFFGLVGLALISYFNNKKPKQQ